MTASEAASALDGLGDKVSLVIPPFASAKGEWLTYSEIAQALWPV